MLASYFRQLNADISIFVKKLSVLIPYLTGFSSLAEPGSNPVDMNGFEVIKSLFVNNNLNQYIEVLIKQLVIVQILCG